MSLQVPNLLGRDAGLDRPFELGLCRDAAAEFERDAGLHQPREAIVRVRLQRLQEFDARAAIVAGLEQPESLDVGFVGLAPGIGVSRRRSQGHRRRQC